MDKIDRLFDAVEHPERYSSVEIEEMLKDPEVKEVFDLLDKTKSSLQAVEIPDIEDEWKKFETSHHSSKLPNKKQNRFMLSGWLSRNVAASIVIGIVSFTAVATIVGVGIHHLSNNREVTTVETPISEVTDVVPNSDTISSYENEEVASPEIVVFDNEPLETILSEIANYYKCQVIFNNNVSKSLRLYFRWNQALTITEVVERLNNFEQINLTIKDATIEVD